MNIKSLYFFLIGIACFGSVSSGVDLDNRVREIAHQLRCPTCQAMSVKESDAGISLNMKQRIRELLEEGKSEEEILRFFVDRYGEWILRSPKKEGFSLLLWTMPGLIIVITVLLLFQYLRKKSRMTTIPDTRPLSEDEQRQIEKDLKRL
ncbi:cytochrome c-type biogenesis protein CcmH [bacterium]|nr:cytochrome c-type biogenesis protein CcmH [bacterium]